MKRLMSTWDGQKGLQEIVEGRMAERAVKSRFCVNYMWEGHQEMSTCVGWMVGSSRDVYLCRMGGRVIKRCLRV